MSNLEKAKERLKSLPRDYTYDEARQLLIRLGFVESNKGKTSGSRVKFLREFDDKAILLHKPHPSKIMLLPYVKDLLEFLKGVGDID